MGGCARQTMRDDKKVAGMSWWDRLRAWIDERFECVDFGTEDEGEQL